MPFPRPDLIDLAIAEDLGAGDVTVAYFLDAARSVRARIEAREALVVAGGEVAAEVFRRVGRGSVEILDLMEDGTAVPSGASVLEASGPCGALLSAERTALNFLQRLSGVASLTRRYVEAVAGTGATILDTRKTTPGFRLLEKAAVRAGGGQNHRLGLFDMAMVKDNHLLVEGGAEALQQALDRIAAARPDVPVELEADTLAQVERFLGLRGVARILLDNMSLDQLRSAVALVNGRVPLEASGGVSLETVRAIAETGVDYISVGALTHSARAVDFSLELLPDRGSRP